MGTFDDVDLDRTDPWHAGNRMPSGRAAAIIGFVILALVAAGFVWWVRTRPTSTRPAVARTQPASAADNPGRAVPAARPLPPLDELDPTVRSLIGELTTSPLLGQWLATGNLARQIASLIEGVTIPGASLRVLAPLRPQGAFEVAERGGRMTIAPQSFHRYDALTEVIASLDAASVVRVYRTLAPRLDEARGDHESDRSLDEVVTTALTRLIETPVPSESPRVRMQGGVYVFADRRLEDLTPTQKLLLRSGPSNATRIQAKLREIAAALGVSGSSPAQPTPTQ